MKALLAVLVPLLSATASALAIAFNVKRIKDWANPASPRKATPGKVVAMVTLTALLLSLILIATAAFLVGILNQ